MKNLKERIFLLFKACGTTVIFNICCTRNTLYNMIFIITLRYIQFTLYCCVGTTLFNLFVQNSFFPPSFIKFTLLQCVSKRKHTKQTNVYLPTTNFKFINKCTLHNDPQSCLLTTLSLSNGIIKRCSHNYPPD